jgi:hypothetical protein
VFKGVVCVCGCVFERLDVWWSIRGGAFEVCKSTAGRGGGGVGVGVSVSISWSSIFFCRTGVVSFDSGFECVVKDGPPVPLC